MLICESEHEVEKNPNKLLLSMGEKNKTKQKCLNAVRLSLLTASNETLGKKFLI